MIPSLLVQELAAQAPGSIIPPSAIATWEGHMTTAMAIPTTAMNSNIRRFTFISYSSVFKFASRPRLESPGALNMGRIYSTSTIEQA
jgi:hypothetical protein